MFGQGYFGKRYFGGRYWGPNGAIVPPDPAPEQDNTRQPGAGGKGKKPRRIIIRADGTRYEPRTEAGFRRAIAEMLDRAEIKEFTPEKAPKTRRPGKKAVKPSYVSPAPILWDALLRELELSAQAYLTEQSIIAAARAAYEAWVIEEEEAEMLLLVA